MWKGLDAKLALCRNNQRLEPGVSHELSRSEREELRAALTSRSTLARLPLYYQTVDRIWGCPRTAPKHGAEQSAEKARLLTTASATLLQLPDAIYTRIMTALFAFFDESKYVNLSSFSLMDGLVFPQDSFINLKEIVVCLNGALLSCKTLRKDILNHLCRRIQFHATISSISSSRKPLCANTFMTPYLRRIKHLRLEVNLERLGGGTDEEKELKLYALRSNLLEFATKLKRDDLEPLELHIVLRRRAGTANSKSKIQPGPQLLSVSTKESSLPANVENVINVLTSLKTCISSLRVSGLSFDHTTHLMQSFFKDSPGITTPYQPTPAIICDTSRISHEELYLKAKVALDKALAKPLLVGPNPYPKNKERITKDTSASLHNNIRTNVRLPVFPGKIDSNHPRPQFGRVTVNIFPKPKSKNRITRSVSDPSVRRDFKHLERSKIGTTRKIWQLSHSACKTVWNSTKRNRYLFSDAKGDSPFTGRTHPQFTRLDAKSFAATLRPLTSSQTRPKKSSLQSVLPRSNINLRRRRSRRRAARAAIDQSAPPVPPLPAVIPSRPIKEYLGCLSPATKNLTSTYIPAAGIEPNRRVSNVNSGILRRQDAGEVSARPRTPLRSPLGPISRTISTANTASIASVLGAPIKLVNRGSTVPPSVPSSTNPLLRTRGPSTLESNSKKAKYTHDTTFTKCFTAPLETAPNATFAKQEQNDRTQDVTSPSPSLRLFNFEIPPQKDVCQYEDDGKSFSSTRTLTQAIYNAHQAHSNLDQLEQNESRVFGQTFIASYQEDSLQEDSILEESSYETSLQEQPGLQRSCVEVNQSTLYDNVQTFAASYQKGLAQQESILDKSISGASIQEQSDPPNSYDHIEHDGSCCFGQASAELNQEDLMQQESIWAYPMHKASIGEQRGPLLLYYGTQPDDWLDGDRLESNMHDCFTTLYNAFNIDVQNDSEPLHVDTNDPEQDYDSNDHCMREQNHLSNNEQGGIGFNDTERADTQIDVHDMLEFGDDQLSHNEIIRSDQDNDASHHHTRDQECHSDLAQVDTEPSDNEHLDIQINVHDISKCRERNSNEAQLFVMYAEISESLENTLERPRDIDDILDEYSRNEFYDDIDEDFDSPAVGTGCQSSLPLSPSGYESFLNSYINTVDASATSNETYFLQDNNELQTSCVSSEIDRVSPPKHQRPHAIYVGSASRNLDSSVGSSASEKGSVAYKDDAPIDAETLPLFESASYDEYSSQQRSAIRKVHTEPWPSFEPVTGHENYQSPYDSPCGFFDTHRRRNQMDFPVRDDSLAANARPDIAVEKMEQRVKSKTSVSRPVDEGGYPDLIHDMRLRVVTEATNVRDTPTRVIQLNAPEGPTTSSFTIEDLHELQAISSILPQTPSQASDTRSAKQEKFSNDRRKLTLGESIRKFSKTLSRARSSGSNDTCDDNGPLPIDFADWDGKPQLLPESCKKSANAARQRRVRGANHAFESQEYTDNELYNASPIIESPVFRSKDQGAELHWFSRDTEDEDDEKLLSFADFLKSAPRYRASIDGKSSKQILPLGIGNAQRGAILDQEAKSMESRGLLEQPVEEEKANPFGKLAKALELDKLQQALKKKDILELMVGTAHSP